MAAKSSGSFLQISDLDKSMIQKKLHVIKNRAEKVGKFFGSFITAMTDISES